jgi:hypothetical protein
LILQDMLNRRSLDRKLDQVTAFFKGAQRLACV